MGIGLTQVEALATQPWPKAPLLLVSSSSRTGPAEGQIAMARYLRGVRLDARVAADTTQPGDIAEKLREAGVPLVPELRMSRKVKVRDVLHDMNLLASWVKQGKPDLLHAAFAHDHHLCLWAAWNAGARRRELRTVRTAHRREDLQPGFLGRRLRALRATDGVVVHADSYRKALLARGFDPERVLALPGCVDARRFVPGRCDELRDEWGIPRGAPLAGMVARMKPERGQRALLHGFARALKEVPDAWLVLVGRGEDEPALRALAKSLSDRIVFGGYRAGPDLVRAYQALDAAVWLREGNDGACRGVLEAMACGKPVVAGKDGAPGELVRDGVDGYLSEPDSPATIAAALSKSLRGASLGENARARAEEFTEERYGSSLLAFYRKLHELPPLSFRGNPLAT